MTGHHRSSVGIEQRSQAAAVRHQRRRRIEHRLQPQRVGDGVEPTQQVEARGPRLRGQEGGQHGGRGAAHEVDRAAGADRGFERLGEVVAGDQPPEAAGHVDGHRHRRAHAHVGEVLEVHRGDRPDRHVGQVQHTGSGLAVGQQRAGCGEHIGDQPDAHAAVEGPGLGRDVARRVAQAQEGRKVGPDHLGHHLPVPLGVEPVDHHPVEAGQVLDDGRRLLEERGGIRRTVEPQQRPLQAGLVVAGRGRRPLDLDQVERLAAVDDRVARPGGKGDRHDVTVLGIEEPCRGLDPQDVDQSRPQHGVDLDPDDLPAVLRRRPDRSRPVHRQKGAVGLHPTGCVDRLDGAAGDQQGKARLARFRHPALPRRSPSTRRTAGWRHRRLVPARPRSRPVGRGSS
ncbi:hypothetical protein BH10ACT1_BH10ACT1_18190 [soil metagenome]